VRITNDHLARWTTRPQIHPPPSFSPFSPEPTEKEPDNIPPPFLYDIEGVSRGFALPSLPFFSLRMATAVAVVERDGRGEGAEGEEFDDAFVPSFGFFFFFLPLSFRLYLIQVVNAVTGGS